MGVVNNRADIRVTLDGVDLMDKIRPRLKSLRLSEKRGDEADQLDLTLDDSDGQLAMPKDGAVLRVEIGWIAGSGVTIGMIDKGSFRVDEVSHGGPPDTIMIRARSADFTSRIRARRDQSWRATTIGAVLRDVAGRNGLTPRIDAGLAAVGKKIVTQSGESDIALIRRLGQEHDAVATIKDGNLLFAPIGAGVTAGGKPIPPATIRRADGDRHQYSLEKRDDFSGVTAHWHDRKGAAKKKVTVGDAENAKVLKKTYPSEAEARRAATAEKSRLDRAPAKFSFDLALGRPDLYPERSVTVSGFKPEIDAIKWLIVETTHDFSDRSGLVSSVQMESAP